MSEIKVNKISPRSGTAFTLGDSGDTFTIPSGATINNQGTAVNFGATGSASWVTTVKTSTFTAVAGEGYFVNTTGGVVSVNLPAGVAGAVVAIKDYAGTFDTNNVTLVQNGSDKIGGSTVNATLFTEGIAVTLVFIDSTQGWLVTDSGLQSESPTTQYVTATGGSIATSGDFKIHTFTGPGTLCVSCAGNASGSNTIEYLIVGAGGGGGRGCSHGAGAGAGGYRVSPSIPVSVQGYPIVVGGGGAGAPAPGSPKYGGDGNLSSGFSISSAGGGGAGGWNDSGGRNGGSGSGSASGPTPTNFGVGNTPPVSPPQGNPGGPVTNAGNSMGGGGGAGEAGNTDGDRTGGDGISNSITGSAVFYAGGGSGGGSNPGADIPGGEGGGGIGGGPPSTAGGAGTANTGGGGGGAFSSQAGGTGGSGVVIIKYKFQN